MEADSHNTETHWTAAERRRDLTTMAAKKLINTEKRIRHGKCRKRVMRVGQNTSVLKLWGCEVFHLYLFIYLFIYSFIYLFYLFKNSTQYMQYKIEDTIKAVEY